MYVQGVPEKTGQNFARDKSLDMISQQLINHGTDQWSKRLLLSFVRRRTHYA